MTHTIIFTAFISLWLMLPAGVNMGFSAAYATDMPADALAASPVDAPEAHQTTSRSIKSSLSVKPDTEQPSKIPAPFYPDPLLKRIGLNPSDIIKNQSKFKNNRIHIEWMDHVHDVLPQISCEKKQALIKIHTSLLFIKDRLDKDFFSARINKHKYSTQLAGVMKWFQEANQSVLSIEEYNALFGISGQDNDRTPASAADGKINFPVNNPETTVEMIKKSFDDTTIRNIARFYQDQSQELRDMKKTYETEDFREEDAKQIKNEMRMIEQELQAAFMSYCRDILSDEQFKLLFGSQRDK